jgi:hypothetical protein
VKYYKVIKDGVIVDADHLWLRWQTKHRIMLACEPEEAQFIQSGDTIYAANWLNPAPAELDGQYEKIPIKGAKECLDFYAEEIGEEEYLSIRAQLDEGLELEDGSLEEAAPVEPEAEEEEPEVKKTTAQSMQEQIDALTQQNEMLLECLLEMSEVVYA